MLEEVTIDKLVHGGQGLGTMADGRKVFVWNALPGEVVRVRIINAKRSYAEGIAEEVVQASAERMAPSEDNYLATSPWQMMTYDAENKYKKQIVEDLFVHEKVSLPAIGETVHDDRQWGYRNKMEYSFWGDDDGLHLALHQRGSHGKQIVTGSKLALPAIDAAANAICAQLNAMHARAGDLKTIIVRSSQNGETVAALYTKLEKFKELALPAELKGLRIYHSNPRSPASVPTQLLYETGDCQLQDELLGKPFVYDVDSFFQVNPPVFELALQTIKQHIDAPDVTDMYAGVGTIGLSVASAKALLVELDPATAAMARLNATSAVSGDVRASASAQAPAGPRAEVIEVSTEKALEYLTPDKPVIFDPPRAGLHDKVTAKVLETLPPQIIYLSCNPATHARDLAKLQTKYTIEHFGVYNFFPRTPHIETLATLRLN